MSSLHFLRSLNSGSAAAAAAVALLASAASAGVPFAFGTNLATATRPSGAAIGDFNRDGRNDVAVTVDTQDRIAIYLGNGDGTFSLNQSIQTGNGTGPDGLIAADIDGDLSPDLIVALHNSNTVRSYMNGGTGNFAVGSNVATGADPSSISGFDLDGDGDMDFATANRDGNNVTVIRNSGGALALVGNVASGGAEPRGVASGDFDRNGTVDLAVTNHDSRSISILNGAGGLTYTLGATLSVPASTRPDGIASGDLDGDGDIDLAVAISDDAFNVVSVYSNNGGTFTGPVSFNSGGLNPSHIALSDLDLDGLLDVVVANEDSGNIGILRSTTSAGAISLGAAMVIVTGAHPEQFSIGDLDGDRVLDIAVPNRDANTTTILLNSTTPSCRADYNNSGSVTVQDIFDFLRAYFANNIAADFNGRDGVSLQDVFEFLIAYFAGC